MTYTHLSDAIPCNTHRGYRLTCEQYEGLLAESEGGCQICGFPAEKMPQRKLYIDHGDLPGPWPVRGLLCIRCNSRLEGGIPFNAAAAAYLANPWYLRQCKAHGVPLNGGPEPAVDELFDVFTERVWRKHLGSWRREDNRARRRDWEYLARDYGPFNLIPIRPHSNT